MLVLVHGGPIARDYWGYDPFVQALATSGIAVLQLNYRGSSGYGAEHQIAGRREWGRNIQKDIISGTRWAIGEGLAAPVLLAHGKKDQRAPYRHAADLRKALKKHNKPFELMIERREGHGFYTAENQVELARRSIEFVKRHTR